MIETTTFDPSGLSIPQLHGYLLAAVAPRPIALASTIDKQGGVNLSPFSFFNVFSANPPVMIFSPARRGTNNTVKHTYENVVEVPEVVVNIVNHAMVEQVSLASSEYPKGVNEFVKAGLTQVDSDKVSPPRVGESPASFECRVKQVIPLGDQGGAGNLIVVEVLLIHVHSIYLNENNVLQTDKLDLVGRMGGSWYVRASKNALFQVTRPGNPPGIGIDQLPESVRTSTVLTGSYLAKLGSLPQLPDKISVEKWANNPKISTVIKYPEASTKLHLLALEMIDKQDLESAIKTLMVADLRSRS
jgi:flavin reductase (DIM6/NTAB) family NADH-FMN oxidoreductase RutF